MTEERDFKRLVRERMAQTGENYTTARATFRSEQPSGDTTPNPEPVTTATDTPYSVQSYLEAIPELTHDQLVSLASIGMPATDLRRYQEVLPEHTIDDLIGAWTMNVTPESIAEWRAIDAEATLDQIVGAATLGLTPELFRKFQASAPALSIDEAGGWMVAGLQP